MKLAMIGIIVKDMKKSIKFYECIGIPVKSRSGDDYVELEEKGIRISLNSKTMIENIYGFETNQNGDKIELAFEMPSSASVDSLCQTVKENGYEVFKEPWDAEWNQRYAIIKDPDQNLLSFFSNL